MKQKYVFEPQTPKLACQLLGGVTFTYDLYLGHLRDNWKGLSKEKNIKNDLDHSLNYLIL